MILEEVGIQAQAAAKASAEEAGNVCMSLGREKRAFRVQCAQVKRATKFTLYRYVVFNTQPYILAQHSQLVIASGV
jgi:hypothetical protein